MALSVDRIQGLSGTLAIKAPVVARSTGNVTLSGLQTVGGVALASGDRVLLVAQTNAVENGIYNAATGTWTRAKDFNGPNDVVQGTLIPVAALADTTLYRIDTANPIVIGTTSLTITALALGNAELTAAIEASVIAAQLAETNAETAETNAAGSAAAASVSAAAASGSAAAASVSAAAASGSASAASVSASDASSSANTASIWKTSAVNASVSAANSANSAALSYDSFDDRYLGAKAADPTVDNDGWPLLTGALYWNTTNGEMRAWSGSAWQAAYATITSGVASVTGASPVASSGGATPSISLSAGYGDTQNPYASKTRYYFLAAPSTADGVPVFRAMVAADVPTLNQDTTGAAAKAGVPQLSQSAAYTCVIGDANTHILHPSADTTARIFTIPANASVAYAIGTTLTFINQNGAGGVTIAITTDTMRLAGQGTTGSRTLAANGVATAVKITSTEWIISGVGLT